VKIVLTDMLGRTVLVSENQMQLQTELNLQGIKTGTYIVTVFEGNQKIGFQKILIN
jgi:hypothetical protein